MLDTGQLGIVAGTRNLKTALEFVRFATTAESMAAVSGYIAYSPARRSSLPLLGTHVEAGVDMNPHMPTYPDNTVRVLQSDWLWSLTTEIRAEPAGRKPSALRALLPPVNTCFVLS